MLLSLFPKIKKYMHPKLCPLVSPTKWTTGRTWTIRVTIVSLINKTEATITIQTLKLSSASSLILERLAHMLRDVRLPMEILKLEQLLNRTNNNSLIWWTILATVWFLRMVYQCQIILINSVCKILLAPRKIWTLLPSSKLSWCNSSKWWWILRCWWLTTCLSCSRIMHLPLKIPTKLSSNSRTWCKWWWCSNSNSLTRCLSIPSRCKLNNSRSLLISNSSSQVRPRTSSKLRTSEHECLWLSLLIFYTILKLDHMRWTLSYRHSNIYPSA